MTALMMWKRVQRWWALALILFVLDWVTKQAIESNLFYGQEIAVLPFFDLTLRYLSLIHI